MALSGSDPRPGRARQRQGSASKVQLLEALGRIRLAAVDPTHRGRRRAASLLPSVLSGYLLVKGFHTELPGFSCPLRALTGIPCPGCYLTRAVAASLHGDVATAWHWHPIGPVAAALLLVWSVVALRQRRLVPERGAGAALAGLAVLLTLAWLARMVATFGFGVRWFPG